LTESVLRQDPLSGHLFVFINRRRDRIKLPYWGGAGFCTWHQRLEQGGYQFPDVATADEQQGIEIARSPWSPILDGIDPSSVRQRRRYRLPGEWATANPPAATLA
jgi:transposase